MVDKSEEGRWLVFAADAAFQQAALKVITRAKQTGIPVVIWQDGHIEEIPSEKLLPNVWANALAIEHRAWLGKFDPQYVQNWEKLLNADLEAALVEAGVRRILQQHGVAVEPNESLTGECRRPDFRCTVGQSHFYVEATAVQIATAEKKTGITDVATGPVPYNQLGMIEAVYAKCAKKASQCANQDGPVLVAIGTFHMNAAMDFSEKRFVNHVATGKSKMAFNVGASGQQLGETYQLTAPVVAAFLQSDATQEVRSIRDPISGLLLCRISAEPSTAFGVLHPKPLHPFDPALLPDIQFAQVELDNASHQLRVRWPEGG